MTTTLLITLVAIVPIMGLLWVIYTTINKHYDHSYEMEAIKLRKGVKSDVLSIRLQAYERLTLFCERLDLPNLLLRLRMSEMTPQQLHDALLIAVQKEYEHNLVQQIYVSEKLWEIIQLTKENVISGVGEALLSLPDGADGQAYADLLMQMYQENKLNAPATAIHAIKKETQVLF